MTCCSLAWVQAGGSAKLEALLAGEAEEATPEVSCHCRVGFTAHRPRIHMFAYEAK